MPVKKGDKVKVDYIGSLDDGTIFDRSDAHGQPLEFEVGLGEVIKGFDDAVMGMNPGDTKKFIIQPEQGYGANNPKMIQTVPRDKLPPGDPKPGMVLMVSLPNGQQIPAKIMEVTATTVTIDLNHPLAGKALHFEITVKGISS